KKILVVMLLTLSFAVFANAQAQSQSGNEDTVTIPKSQLTPEQLQKVQQEQLDEKIKTYGKWVGIGKEVGVAVNSSLESITNQADHFAKTGVGKFTMVLVTWKVIGTMVNLPTPVFAK